MIVGSAEGAIDGRGVPLGSLEGMEELVGAIDRLGFAEMDGEREGNVVGIAIDGSGGAGEGSSLLF